MAATNGSAADDNLSAKNFSEIPVLDYMDLAKDRAKFIASLQNVLTNVGFTYMKNTPVPWSLVKKVRCLYRSVERSRAEALSSRQVLSYADPLFALPFEEKLAFEMAKTPHFLGYNRLGYEVGNYLWKREPLSRLTVDTFVRSIISNVAHPSVASFAFHSRFNLRPLY
jgi:hypothetical protein